MNQNVDLLACPSVNPAQVLAFFGVTLISCPPLCISACCPALSFPAKSTIHLPVYFLLLSKTILFYILCMQAWENVGTYVPHPFVEGRRHPAVTCLSPCTLSRQRLSRCCCCADAPGWLAWELLFHPPVSTLAFSVGVRVGIIGACHRSQPFTWVPGNKLGLTQVAGLVWRW